MSLVYILPLIAAIIYPIGSLFIKRALASGAGPMRFSFCANITLLLAFMNVLFWDSEIVDFSYWWTTVIAAVVHFIGIVLTYVAIRVGEVTVQTPLMGTKLLFVAAFSVLLGSGPVPLTWWIAAVVAMLGIFVLSKPSGLRSVRSSNLSLTVLLCLGSSFFFGICDVMIQKYARLFGEGPFLAATFFFNALLSLSLIPFFEGKLTEIPKEGWKWAFLGLACVVAFTGLIYITISFYGNATAINVLYSSRGIWSILVVFAAGGLIGNQEAKAGKRVMARRFIGAGMLFAAIVLVLTTDIP